MKKQRNKPRFSFRKHGNAAGFTLPEMLAVMVLMLVLAAILMPLWQSARMAAGRAGCMGNLKQLMAASYLWAGDNHGMLPNGSEYWEDQGYPIYPVRSSCWYIWDVWPPLGPSLMNYLNNGTDARIFFCPGNAIPPQTWVDTHWPTPYGKGNGTTGGLFSINYLYYGFLNGPVNAPAGLYPMSPTKISDPGRSLVWGDSSAVNAGTTTVVEGPTGYYYINHMNSNHVLDGANWAHLDGSVVWYPASQLKLTANLNGTPQYYIPTEAFPSP